jgi:hypothetical protein
MLAATARYPRLVRDESRELVEMAMIALISGYLKKLRR